MKISSSFWRFPGSEWESATLSPHFHFFSFATSCFFHFPLFLMVFHCFSLFFMAFLDFRCHGQGKWKKNEKMKKKKWKNENSSSFWRFPGSEWGSATLSPNFHFFSNFIFFSFSFVFDGFPLFSIVFHCFSLFFMVFLGFRCHGKGKWKKNDKQKWSLKWKKWSLKWKNDVWNEKNEVWRNKKWKKMKNIWKINENKKMFEKQNEKMKLQMKTQMEINEKKNKHFPSVARCESYNTNIAISLHHSRFST